MINKLFNKQMSKGVKASLAFFASSVVTKGISYLVTPIYTRILTTTEYGSVATYLTWVQVLGIVAMFCLSYGVFDNGLLDYEDRRDEYSFSMLVLSNICTVVFTVALGLLYPVVGKILKMSPLMIGIMIAIFLTQPSYNFWAARKRFEYDYKPLVTATIFCAIISPLTAIAFIVLSDMTDHTIPRIVGAELPLIITYGFFCFMMAKKAGFKIETKYWKTSLLFNFPLIPHYLSTYLLNSSDKIMISHYVDDSAVALYSVAHSVAAVANIIWTSANSSLVPYTYQKCREKDYDSINKVMIPLLSVFVLASVCVILLAPEVVRVMAAADYMESIYVIPPIVGSVFFQVQYYVYANIVYYYKKPKFVMIGSIAAVISNLVLNYIFIPQYGYLAAGYTTLFSYALQAVIDFFGMRRAAQNSVYDMKAVLLLSILLVAISLVSNLIYDYTALRYIVLMLIFAGLWIYRNKIIDLFKTVRRKNE